MKNYVKTFLIFLFIFTCYFSYSQCVGNEPVLFLGNDISVCQGVSTTLTAPNGYGYYNWSDNTHLNTIVVNTSGTYSVEVGNVGATNLIVNGNFEAGNTGFTTSYTLGAQGAGPWGPLSNPGAYQITTKPSLVHSNYSSTGVDHTAAPGTKMFIANGSGTPGTMVWSQTVAVSANTDYVLGAWFMSVITDPNVANLQFFINGIQIGNVFSTNPTKDIWEQITNTWNSGSSTSAILSIINQNSVNTGNDFAIDDITFYAVCKKTDLINITVVAPQTQTVSALPRTSCNGIPDGSISINITSGTALEYSFDNGVNWQVSNIKTGLNTGVYSVKSKNAAGCIVSENVTISGSANLPTQTISLTPSTTCNGIGNGSITVNSATAIEYSFDGGANWVTTPTLTGLSSGTFIVESKDISGCIASETVNLIATNSVITVGVIASVVTACQNEIVTLTANGIGGTSYTYVWNDFTSSSSTQSFTASITKSYGVKAVNQDGCESTIQNVLVTVLDPLSASISSPITVCPNQLVMLSVTNVSGGKIPYSYSWNNGSTSASTNVVVNSNASYSVLLQDGCSNVFQLQTSVSISSGVSPSISINDSIQCEPASFIVSNLMDPNLIQSSTWEVSNGDKFQNQNTITINSTKSGSYDLSLTIVTNDGCIESVFLPKALIVSSKPIADFTYIEGLENGTAISVDFTNASIGASNYYWISDNNVIDSSKLANTSFEFPNTEVKDYKVTLIAVSSSFCIDSISKIIEINPDRIIYTPNSFTPNGDGTNDFWKVSMLGFSSHGFELSIFDRWGEEVWITKDENAGWDGKFKSKDLSSGMYSWIIIAKDVRTDKKYQYGGKVNLFR